MTISIHNTNDRQAILAHPNAPPLLIWIHNGAWHSEVIKPSLEPFEHTPNCMCTDCIEELKYGSPK